VFEDYEVFANVERRKKARKEKNDENVAMDVTVKRDDFEVDDVTGSKYSIM
jgi:hypothetical protein